MSLGIKRSQSFVHYTQENLVLLPSGLLALLALWASWPTL